MFYDEIMDLNMFHIDWLPDYLGSNFKMSAAEKATI